MGIIFKKEAFLEGSYLNTFSDDECLLHKSKYDAI